MTVAEITSLALQLGEGDRAEIMHHLLESFEPCEPDPDDFGADSVTEAIHRSNEIKLGLVKPLTEEEFWDAVHVDRAQ